MWFLIHIAASSRIWWRYARLFKRGVSSSSYPWRCGVNILSGQSSGPICLQPWSMMGFLSLRNDIALRGAVLCAIFFCIMLLYYTMDALLFRCHFHKRHCTIHFPFLFVCLFSFCFFFRQIKKKRNVKKITPFINEAFPPDLTYTCSF